MHKILTALAVVALVALGTSIIASLILRSSIDKQARQIGALDRAEAADHREISRLQAELHTAKADHQVTSAPTATMAASRVIHPIGQPGLAVASPELLLTIRHDSLTAWNALAGIPLSSDTSAPGH
jgi:uncharacterized protein involved in copper resistance